MSILSSSNEKVSPSEESGGFSLLGRCDAKTTRILKSGYDNAVALFKDKYERSLLGKDIFWINFWQRSDPGVKIADIPEWDYLCQWANQILQEHYPDDTTLDSFGIIMNPIGSPDQYWHIDYGGGYSTVFVPLTEISTLNATQYISMPSPVSDDVKKEIYSDIDNINFNKLASIVSCIEVKQKIAPPFSILKMDFGCIHRGISNRDKYHRVLYWMSFSNNPDLCPYEDPFAINEL